MLNRSSLLAAWALLILVSPWIGSAASEEEPQLFVSSSSASVTITGNVVPSTPPITPVTNPAATFCVDQGYSYEIRTDPSTGDQAGYCIFPDESECEEWAFFRGSCSPPSPPAGPPEGPMEEPLAPPVPTGDGEDDDGPMRSMEAPEVDEIREEMEPLLEKEAAGTLTAEEAAALASKRLELLDAEVALLEAKGATLAAEMAWLDLESRRLALEAERLALVLEGKRIERRGLFGLSIEGDEARFAEIELILLIIDLSLEELEIEERAMSGTAWPEDEGRLAELAEAIAYLGGRVAGGVGPSEEV